MQRISSDLITQELEIIEEFEELAVVTLKKSKGHHDLHALIEQTILQEEADRHELCTLAKKIDALGFYTKKVNNNSKKADEEIQKILMQTLPREGSE